MPGSGDSIQALKAGVMEIPDVIVINKADHPLTDTMVREIRGVLSLANLDRSPEEARAQLARADRQDRGQPTARGIDELVSASRRTARTSSPPASWPSGAGATCATRCSRSPPRACAGAWRRACGEDPHFQRLIDEVVERRLDPASAADGAARAHAVALRASPLRRRAPAR